MHGNTAWPSPGEQKWPELYNTKWCPQNLKREWPSAWGREMTPQSTAPRSHFQLMSFPETLTKTQPAADPGYFLLLKKNEIQTESFPPSVLVKAWKVRRQLKWTEVDRRHCLPWGRPTNSNGRTPNPSTGDAGGSCSEGMVYINIIQNSSTPVPVQQCICLYLPPTYCFIKT